MIQMKWIKHKKNIFKWASLLLIKVLEEGEEGPVER